MPIRSTVPNTCKASAMTVSGPSNAAITQPGRLRRRHVDVPPIFWRYTLLSQGRNRLGVRLSSVTSLMLAVFSMRIRRRPRPVPMPPCGGQPYLKKSR